MKQHFLSDNASPAHPDVLTALAEANDGYEAAYGQDSVTYKAQTLFKEQFGDSCAVFFTSTGTASNVIALKSILAPCEAVLCADSAHLYRDECAAPEALLGTKLIPVKSHQGKIAPEMLSPFLERKPDGASGTTPCGFHFTMHGMGNGIYAGRNAGVV